MHLPQSGRGQRVVGVSLPVPEPHGTWLQELRIRLGDDLARQVPAHITLLGPTLVRDAELGAVESHLREVARRHRPFVVALAGASTFRPVSPVVYATLSEGAEECAALEESMRSGVLAGPTRFDYHPHVTVAHGLTEESLDTAERELAGFEARYPVLSMCTYIHRADGVWHLWDEIPLMG